MIKPPQVRVFHQIFLPSGGCSQTSHPYHGQLIVNLSVDISSHYNGMISNAAFQPLPFAVQTSLGPRLTWRVPENMYYKELYTPHWKGY